MKSNLNDVNLRAEWAKDFQDKSFPKAGKITEEHRIWAFEIIDRYLNDKS